MKQLKDLPEGISRHMIRLGTAEYTKTKWTAWQEGEIYVAHRKIQFKNNPPGILTINAGTADFNPKNDLVEPSESAGCCLMREEYLLEFADIGPEWKF